MKLPLPKRMDGDPLWNRRILAYYSLGFCVFWVFQVFWIDIAVGIETAKVIAYLSVPASFSGLSLWEYIRAARKDDEKP